MSSDVEALIPGDKAGRMLIPGRLSLKPCAVGQRGWCSGTFWWFAKGVLNFKGQEEGSRIPCVSYFSVVIKYHDQKNTCIRVYFGLGFLLTPGEKWQQVAGGGSWKIMFSYTGMNQRNKGGGIRLWTVKFPSNILSPARLHLLKVPWLP